MSNIIDSIQVSGVTYTIQGSGGGVPESAFTAYTAATDARIAEDEEVTAAGLNTLNKNKLDASAYTPTDLSNYYTKSQTSGATQIQTALDDISSRVGGVEYFVNSDFPTYTAATDTALSNKVDNSTYTAYTASTSTALSGKQDTLSAGTNITIVDNVISAEGGGKAVSGGTNISITTGETADTINCTLPIKKIQGYDSVIIGDSRNTVQGNGNVAVGYQNSIIEKTGSYTPDHCFVGGEYNNVYSTDETAFGKYNISVQNTSVGGESGTTLFSVGNGTSNNARHNAFEIRKNGDIYLTKDGQDVKLQDQLGGGGIPESAFTAYTASTDSRIAEDEEVTAAALNNLNDKFGGLQLVKLTQQEYDALSPNYDSNTLYIVTDS